MSGLIEEVNDENFATAVLESKQPVLVDFWAEWCGPCRTLAPVIEGLAGQYAGAARIVKLNVDDNPALSERYRVMAIPTLILFQNGEEKERTIGTSQRESIVRMIEAYVSTEGQ
jgi:thioredoxin 1